MGPFGGDYVMRMEPYDWDKRLYKRESRELAHPSHHVRTQTQVLSMKQKVGPYQTLILPALWILDLILEFLVSRTVGNFCCWGEH